MPVARGSRLLLGVLVPCALAAQTYTISTVAGGGFPSNIPATSAVMQPNFVAADRSGNLYFSDTLYNAVFRVDAATGVITVVAGNGTAGSSGDGGPATSASLYHPAGVAVDSSGNVYVADQYNFRVREISNGVITTVAGGGTGSGPRQGGPAVGPTFSPLGVAVDSSGNLYFADYNYYQVFKVSGGVLSIVAGNGISGNTGDGGPATAASLAYPYGVALDSAGNLYISDSPFSGASWDLNGRIRKVSNGVITTVAGGGTTMAINGQTATTAMVHAYGLTTDAAGSLYFAEYLSRSVLKLAGGILTYVAGGGTVYPGNGGPATATALFNPIGVAIDAAGNLYFADQNAGLLRKVSGSVITTSAGGGNLISTSAAGPVLAAPVAITADKSGDVFVVDTGMVREVAGNTIAPVAGNGEYFYQAPVGDNGLATNAYLDAHGVAVSSSGNIYIADTSNDRIREVSGGIITTIAGNGQHAFGGDGGPATSAALSGPGGVAIDTAGDIWIADSDNSRIRKISNGVIMTIAGNGTSGYSGDGGSALSAQIIAHSVAVDPAGTNVYIVDDANNLLRRVANGTITTIAGGANSLYSGDGGPAASAGVSIAGVAADSAGNIYIADRNNNRIRKISNGIITTIAGNGKAGSTGDGAAATSAELNGPQAVAVDSTGKVYVADTGNSRIRLLAPPPLLITGPSSEPSGEVGFAYSGTALTASGGLPPYTWSATSLPPGLTLAAIGAISGTPTTSGIWAPVFSVKDSLGNSANVTLSIEIDSVPQVAGLQNAGSFASGAVAPGEIVVVYGSGIGPASLTLAQVDTTSGLLQTSVGGTVVQFNGIAAPLVYSSAGQVAAIVPFELAGLASAQLVVRFQGKGIAASTVQVVASAPSIFTTGSGTGQASALNQDSTVNSPSNPAAAGSTIVLYLTGGGQTNPGSIDGQIVTSAPFPQPTLPVTVTIGGQQTTYAYAGAAPYEVAGVWQINAAIPQGVTGNAVPVSVQIGTTSTQTAVTIAVR